MKDNLGRLIREERIKQSMILKELSKQTLIDVCQLSKIEMGRELPSPFELDKINYVLKTKFILKDYKLNIEHKKKIEAIINGTRIALEKIQNKIKETGKRQGFIICPICNKRLFFDKHTNGHIWGKCETINCLSWMQ